MASPSRSTRAASACASAAGRTPWAASLHVLGMDQEESIQARVSAVIGEDSRLAPGGLLGVHRGDVQCPAHGPPQAGSKPGVGHQVHLAEEELRGGERRAERALERPEIGVHEKVIEQRPALCEPAVEYR